MIQNNTCRQHKKGNSINVTSCFITFNIKRKNCVLPISVHYYEKCIKCKTRTNRRGKERPGSTTMDFPKETFLNDEAAPRGSEATRIEWLNASAIPKT